MPSVVHLIRHGEVYNPAAIRYGQIAGYRLSERGNRQAAAAGRHLRSLGQPIAAILSSPLERAVETARILERELAPGRFDVDARLIEPQTRFDGLPKLAVLWPRMWPNFWNPFRPSWGEPFESIAARMRRVVDDARGAHPGSTIVLVSHQGPIWITRHSYDAWGPPWLSRVRCTHASVTSLRYVNGRYAGSTYWTP